MIEVALNLLVMIVSTYSLGLFIWWWLKVKRATKVYSYVTFLYLALSVGSINHVILHNHFIHHMVPVLLLTALIPVAIRMSRRVWILAKGTEVKIIQVFPIMAMAAKLHYPTCCKIMYVSH